jgi:hypothetical protein
MKLVQINLHHSKGAMGVLCWEVSVGIADVAFIQKYWIYGGHTRGNNYFMLHQMVMHGPAFMSGTALMPYLVRALF